MAARAVEEPTSSAHGLHRFWKGGRKAQLEALGISWNLFELLGQISWVVFSIIGSSYGQAVQTILSLLRERQESAPVRAPGPKNRMPLFATMLSIEVLFISPGVAADKPKPAEFQQWLKRQRTGRVCPGI